MVLRKAFLRLGVLDHHGSGTFRGIPLPCPFGFDEDEFDPASHGFDQAQFNFGPPRSQPPGRAKPAEDLFHENRAVIR